MAPYTKKQTETSYKALVEISATFNKSQSLRKKFVLTGGWAPYFISLGKFDHTGSRDVDLVLSLELMEAYVSIERLMTEKLGYKKGKPFEFKRTDQGIAFEVHFLCEPEHVPRDTHLFEIQDNIRALVVPGCSIVFQDSFSQEVGGNEILVSGPIASVSLKAHAFHNDHNRFKDPYDIYSVLVSVDDIAQRLSSWASRNPFVEESIELLNSSFQSMIAPGPTGAAEYFIVNPSDRAQYAAKVFTEVNSILRKIR